MDPRQDSPSGPTPEPEAPAPATSDASSETSSEPAPEETAEGSVGWVAPQPPEAALEPVEPAGIPATQPVGPRSSRTRWAVALGAIALVAVLSVATALTISSAGQTSLTAGAIPKDSLVFASLRTDLPGDQRQKLAELLAHFPGFADQSILEQSIGETLDKIIRAGTDGKHDYTTEIKPWLGGEVAVAITRGPASGGGAGGALIVVQATDTAKAEAWVRGLAAASGAVARPDETYDGVTLHSYSEPNGTSAEAVSGQLVLVGDEESVKAGLDAKQHGDGLDTSDQFRTAAKSLSGDHLASVYVDIKGFFRDAMQAVASASPSVAAQLPTDLVSRLPAWGWLGVRAESSALVMDAASPKMAGAPSTSDRVSVLAPRLPASTVAAFESHDLGTALKTVLDELGKEPATKQAADQIRQALALLGGVDRLLGWMGDTAVVVTHAADTFGGGIVLRATDAKAAADALSQVRSLLTIALSSSGATMSDETYAGTTITTVDLTDVVKAASGGSTTIPVGAKIGLSFAVRDDLVVFGVGDEFVKAVLDTKSGSSLADGAAYKAALEAAGSSNAGQSYVDLGAIVSGLVPLLPSDAQSQYTKEYKPYLDHLAAIALVGRSGDPQVARYVLTIK